jgi:molybdate transport system ATP-binding protein
MIQIEIDKKLSAVSGNLDLKVTMSIRQGELVALYGESGAGKTSVLRMIAGLLSPDRGRIKFGDDWWFDHEKKFSLSTQKRPIGIVFQDYALFPNMTVQENIAYALSSAQLPATVEELIVMMELTNLAGKKPHVLSGGQRQRVALARAIARRPSLLLLDEPFAALDTALRLRMQEFVLKVHKQFELTTIIVSHDLLEVARLADRVFVLENGLISKSGKPTDVIPFHHIENLLNEIREKFTP